MRDLRGIMFRRVSVLRIFATIIVFSKTLLLIGKSQDSIPPSASYRLFLLAEDGYLEEEDPNLLQDNEEGLLWHFDLQTISGEELRNILGVTEFQASAFLDFRKKQTPGSFTLKRLKEIPGWDRKTIDRVSPYFERESSSVTSYSRRQKPAFLRYQVAGIFSYKWDKNASEKFLGSPFELQLRTQIETRDLSLGLLADNDRYEPLFSNGIKGVDRYSFFFETKEVLPGLKRFIIGDFRLSLGQGLIVRNSFMRGTYAASLERREKTLQLRHNLSGSGLNNFRGVALHVERWGGEALVAYSQQSLDAKYSQDSPERGLYGVKYDSPHRTKEEIQKRHKASEKSLIGRIGYQGRNFKMGINGIYIHWNGLSLAKYLPGYLNIPIAYNLKNDFNFSTDAYYHHPSGRLDWALEVAFSKGLNPALVTSINLLDRWLGSLFISVRALSPQYHARRANSLFRQANAGNEVGAFARYEWQPGSWDLSAYIDCFRQIRPTVPEKTLRKSVETFAKVGYRLKNDFRLFGSFSLRKTNFQYRYWRLQMASEWYATSKLRVFIRLQHKHLENVVDRSPNIQNPDNGSLLSVLVHYTPNPSFKSSLSFAYFDTQSHSSRQFVNHPRIRYSSSQQFYYGKGISLVLLLSKYLKAWQFQISYGLTSATKPQEKNVRRRDHLFSVSIAYKFKKKRTNHSEKILDKNF